MTSKKCPECNNEVEENSLYCSNCGYPIKELHIFSKDESENINCKMIECPECHSKIKDELNFCPECGFPFNKLKEEEKRINDEVSQKINNKNTFASRNANKKNIDLNGIKTIASIICILLTIVNALEMLSNIFWFINTILADGLFSLDTFLSLVVLACNICLTIGFLFLVIFLLQKNKNKTFEIAPILIVTGYIISIFIDFYSLLSWFSMSDFLILFADILSATIWSSFIKDERINILKKLQNIYNYSLVISIIGMFLRLIIFFVYSYRTYLILPSLFIVLDTLVFNLFFYLQKNGCFINNTEYHEYKSTSDIKENYKFTNDKEENSNKGEIIMDNNQYKGYTPVWKVIVFSLLTFNIYTYIWIYRTIGFFNSKRIGEERSQSTQVVLCLFVPFYIVYWLYKQSKLTEEYTRSVGNYSNDLSVISLILSLFGLAIVSIALIQDQINKNIIKEYRYSNNYEYHTRKEDNDDKIKSSYSKEVYQDVNNFVQVEQEGRMSNEDIEYLKKLKELYDMGILSEEEYQSKKESVLK